MCFLKNSALVSLWLLSQFLPRSGAPLILAYKKKSLRAIGKNPGFAACTDITVHLPILYIYIYIFVLLQTTLSELLFHLFGDECPFTFRSVQ